MLSEAGDEVTTIARDGCVRAWYWDTVDQADPPEDDPFVELNPVAETCVRTLQINALFCPPSCRRGKGARIRMKSYYLTMCMLVTQSLQNGRRDPDDIRNRGLLQSEITQKLRAEASNKYLTGMVTNLLQMEWMKKNYDCKLPFKIIAISNARKYDQALEHQYFANFKITVILNGDALLQVPDCQIMSLKHKKDMFWYAQVSKYINNSLLKT